MQEVVRSILRRLRVVIRSGGSFVVFFCFSFPYRFCRNSCNGKCGAIDDGPARPVGAAARPGGVVTLFDILPAFVQTRL